MITIKDSGNGEIIGVTYSREERDAALFATRLYHDQLMAGRVSDDAKVVQAGVAVTDEVMRSLSDGLSTVDPRVHAVARTLLLPYVVRMHEGLSPANRMDVCLLLAVSPEELTVHALTARSMVDDTAPQTTSIDFSEAQDRP